MSADDPCHDVHFNHCFDFDGAAPNTSLTVNVRVTQQGDVISGDAPTTVTFAPGSSYANLTISTDDDSTVEATGTIKAEILNGPGYSPMFVVLAETADDFLPSSIRTVYDNDLTLSINDASATEGTDTTLDFTVSLNAAAPQEYTVDVATTDGDATSHGNRTLTSLGRDFTGTAQTITFAQGEQTRTFSVPIEDDTFQERRETFTATLSNPQGYSQLADASA